jgi:hypothetical protein
MGLLTIVEPVLEPVTLTEACDFLRVAEGSDDAVIQSLIVAARRWCEAYTQRRFITQTLRLLMDFFPGYIDMKVAGEKVSSPFVSGANAVLVGIRYAIMLPCPPVTSIVQFTYQDANGNPVTMVDGTNYIKDLSSQPARLMPPFGQMWPVARVIANAVQVDYVCGYGADPATVPDMIKIAIKLLVSNWYEKRLPDEADIPMAVKALLMPYRDLRF